MLYCVKSPNVKKTTDDGEEKSQNIYLENAQKRQNLGMDGFVTASMEWNHHSKDLQSKPPAVSVVQSKQLTSGQASLSRTTYGSKNSPPRLRSLHVLRNAALSQDKIVTSESSCHGLLNSGDGSSEVQTKECLLPTATRKRREVANSVVPPRLAVMSVCRHAATPSDPTGTWGSRH